MFALNSQLNRLSKFGKFRQVGRTRMSFVGGGNNDNYNAATVKNLLTQSIHSKFPQAENLFVTVTSAGFLDSRWNFTASFSVDSDDVENIFNNIGSAIAPVLDDYTVTLTNKTILSVDSFPQGNQTGQTVENSPYNNQSNTINANQTNVLVSNNYYRVVKGDTLAAIAKRFNTTVARLRELNSGININVIKVGQLIKVKGQGDESIKSNTGNSTLDTVLDTATSAVNTVTNGVTNANDTGFLSSLGLGAGITTPIVLGLGALAIIIVLKK